MWRLLRRSWMREGGVILLLVVFALALMTAPQQAMEGAQHGLSLCFNVIVPSLFPFFVLSSLVVDLGLAAYLGRALEGVMQPLFRVNGCCGSALALGFLGGYPVGARTAIQLYEQGLCSRGEAERLLAFCNNSGPAFILGVVGAGVFGDGRIGLLLYATHALASVLVGLLFRFHGAHTPRPARRTPASKPIQAVNFPAAFTGAVTRSFQNTLNICAFVTFFAVVLQLLEQTGGLALCTRLLGLLGLSAQWSQRMIAGLLELSSGVSSLSTAGQLAQQISMAAFMLGWAGLSVHCQVLSFLVDSGLSPRTYLAGKFCHGLLAGGLTWLVTRWIPVALPVSDYLLDQTESIAALDFSTALALSTAVSVGAWLLVSALCTAIARKNGGTSRRHPVY